MNKNDLIKQLNLAEHVEGGYFVRTYQSPVRMNDRALMSSIYYMLTDNRPIGYFHNVKADILHYFHLGSPIKYLTISPSGELETFTLGPNLSEGQVLQKIVKAEYWKASILESGEFGLLSEAVCPEFDYRYWTMAKPEALKSQFPHLWDNIAPYIKPELSNE